MGLVFCSMLTNKTVHLIDSCLGATCEINCAFTTHVHNRIIRLLYAAGLCDQRVHQIDKLIDFNFSLSRFPTDFISSGKCGSVWQFYGLDPILRKERGEKIHQERSSEIMS